MANFIKKDRIVEKIMIREKYVDKVITKEVPVPVERVVVKEVPVYVDKVVDRIVYKEVYIDKVHIGLRRRGIGRETSTVTDTGESGKLWAREIAHTVRMFSLSCMLNDQHTWHALKKISGNPKRGASRSGEGGVP